jgi:lipoprotein NlpI
MCKLLTVLALLLPGLQVDPGDRKTLESATAAVERGEWKTAMELAEQVLKATPRSALAHVIRGQVKEKQGDFAGAVADQTKALELSPTLAIAYQHRGTANFKLGKFAESIADFDSFLSHNPDREDSHWQRGISCYYAGRFADGAKQFKDGDVVFADDVENAVWHYLCVARMDGVAKARAGLLKVKADRRVPMMQVYGVFAGKLKPEDVLTAANKTRNKESLNEQLFYAHLYLALYYEAEKDSTRALENLELAVQHPIGHYMFDVARVHRDLLKKGKGDSGAKK